MSCVQVLGPKTYAGKQMAAVGNHHRGKEVLDIHLLKAAAHEAVAHPRLGLVPCTDDTRPEWVTCPYRNAHPILRWLPSKLAEWLSENLAEELAIPAKRGDKWTVEELNTVLENNLVASGSTGGQIRPLVPFNGSVSCTGEGPRLAAIHSIWMVIASGERTLG